MLILFAIILCVSVFMIPVSIYSYSKYVTEVNKPKPKRELQDLSYKELMEILNFTVLNTWKYNLTYYFKLHDVVYPKYEEEVRRMSREVCRSLSPEIQQQLYMYFTATGLAHIIGRAFQDLLWEYMVDRSGLQGIYQYIYGENREQLKRDLEEMRNKRKGPRNNNYGDSDDPSDIGPGTNNFF